MLCLADRASLRLEASGPVSPGRARDLILAGCAPAGLCVRGRLDLSQTAVRELPAGLRVDSLDVTACASLRELPEGLAARSVKANHCRALRTVPRQLACYELE